ncbi:hypothetical protein [Nocardia araoensis]|uniref:hypothetical protein n=1 Tax=Nocardia araoensis TaxID=228600 RepID=UPI0003036042|nr:hypothetical protein [Nocardia araoensis]
MSAEQDLSRGFPEYHRAPPDVVPRRTLPADDIPVGDVQVTYFEFTEEGIERVTENIYVTPPFTERSHTDD